MAHSYSRKSRVEYRESRARILYFFTTNACQEREECGSVWTHPLKGLNMSQLSIMQEIRKPATPSGNRHGGRKTPRPTRAEIAAMLEEEMDEGEADDKISEN